MALTKKQRDELPDDDFAVPETRDLPIQDKLVDQTKGLSDEQRKAARERILKKAKDFGVDTSDWESVQAAPDANEPYAESGDLNEKVDFDDQEKMYHDMERQQEEQENAEQLERIHGMSLSAMSMEFPDPVKDHPNQTPFKGVMSILDEPSDSPLSGSNGKCVILPTSVATDALPSLIGMAVDFTHNFDGHDARQKIGLITGASIVGNKIEIEGFFYGADFPSEVKRIQAEKSQMGFSFEAQAKVRSMNDDPLVIKDCVFTGAAVLYKDKAAYTTTSLSAKKMEIDEMTPELKKVIEDLQSQVASLETKLAASNDAKLSAGSVAGLVKPHADALRACAGNMSAAGIGMHAKAGHVAMLHGMADQMESEAALGRMPHVYQNYDFLGASALGASADKAEKLEASALTVEIKKVSETLASVQSQLVDAEKARFDAAAQPERKTLDPAILKLLAKSGINPDATAGKMTPAEIDKLFAGSDMSVRDRIRIKGELQQAGKIAV